MVLPLQRLGGSGPLLLILHANGFMGACYEPLAAQLWGAYTVVALDAPGQGASAPLPAGCAPLTTAGMVGALLDAVRAHGLRGCRVFGHSLGGSLALLAEAAAPGTFCAMYLFEPVAAPAPAAAQPGQGSPSPPQLPPAASSPPEGSSQAGGSGGGLPSDDRSRAGGLALADMVRRRRAVFESPAAAAAWLRARPPYSQLAPAVLDAYVRHGLTQQAPPAGRAGGSSSSAAGGGEGAATWRLVTDPATEAAVFEAFAPVPRLEQPGRVACPVRVAVGGVAEPPHHHLPAFGRALAAQLPRGELRVWPGQGHLGPFVEPGAIGAEVAAWLAAPWATLPVARL